MRLKEYLKELAMRKGTLIKYGLKTDTAFYATIYLENNEIFNVYANSTPYTEEELSKQYKDLKLDTSLLQIWTVAFEDSKGNIGVSPKGKGTSLQIFAALEEYIKALYKRERPQGIYFSGISTEASRLKLYGLLTKKIEKRGYKYFKGNVKGGFLLVRKDELARGS
jgi:hypothetical protein